MSALQVHQFPCLSDNYGYLVHCADSGETACIDTPETEAILAAAGEKGWRITQIWNTHHHWDHAGGNLALKEVTAAKIIGPAYDRERIPGIDVEVSEGDRVRLGSHEAEVVFTPGHTSGHIVYYMPEDRCAFVGDTLFALGCGRLFEGSPQEMWSSLSKLRAWPDETKIFCAHEYTAANAKFALSVDPDNRALQAYALEVEARRGRDEPTVPTTIGLERDANPFLRPDDPAIRALLQMPDATDDAVFGEIRRRKDVF